MPHTTDEHFMNASRPGRASIAIRLIAVNLCALAFSRVALAHPEFNDLATNRYEKLTLLSPSEARLAYTVMYGATPALEARRAADANHDGKLDAAESRTLGAELLARVQKNLSLTVDGKPAQLTWEPPQVGLLGDGVAPLPFSIDLVARVACPGAPPHTLTLDDRTEVPSLGETEVRVEDSPTTTLLASHRGPDGDEKERVILFRGPKLSSLEDRSVTVRFGAGTPPPPATKPASERPARPLLYPVAVVAILLFVGLGVRARRKRR